MESKTEDNKKSEARGFGSHVALHALHHIKEIDGLTATALLRQEILKKPAINEDQKLAQVIAGAEHPDRLKIAPGPIIAYYVGGKKTDATCVPTPVLLLSADKNTRAGALEHLTK